MARRLGIPARTWYNYEHGVTVPADIILKIMVLTSVEAKWLLLGQGPKFGHARIEQRETTSAPKIVASNLIRTALQLLEHEELTPPKSDGELACSELAVAGSSR
jgi:hypothetical protein